MLTGLSQTEQMVIERLRARVPAAIALTPATRIDELEIDALEFIEVIMSIEEEEAIEIPDEICFSATTIADLARAIEGGTPAMAINGVKQRS